ncbi:MULTISPECIES: flavin reductase family protein [Micromonospora]|uniref:NADH-FMN oxidoreductase RutF, flavin reductase (DIM6/NTAB) family n=1 Tax=Micromonospora haikouensis TaxID=686309 RepID=A0A1C4UEK7_9ACTN|nr:MULTISPECIES: flavin reductase family protein [Micromonospora]MDI5942582.1 flavin reductase family protein [Micromonospora sp. DH15]SCE70120.1 NADH-FMN oxidoreductase RutF, flavin reductase (DIM6/NTAB) family [Micromonospora haikouensis]
MTTVVPRHAVTGPERATPADGAGPDRAAPRGSGPERATPVGGPELREFMRSWATGVAVVTSRAAGHPVGCTVNAFTSVSLHPPLLLVSLARTSRTLAAITAEGGFAVNLLGRRQRALADRFATGAVEDRFAGVAHRALDGMPLLDGAMAAAVCAVTQLIAVADHVLVLGSPYWCEATDDADPAVFLGGRYRTVSPA